MIFGQFIGLAPDALLRYLEFASFNFDIHEEEAKGTLQVFYTYLLMRVDGDSEEIKEIEAIFNGWDYTKINPYFTEVLYIATKNNKKYESYLETFLKNYTPQYTGPDPLA